MCAREDIGASSMLRLMRRAVALARMLQTIELGVESSAAETDLVLVVLHMLNS